MTGWTSADSVRHIPEDELHAYLDQALSRTQCVEIECHLAECHRCAVERDRAAAVRDRVTALLAETTPRPVILAPPLEQLRARGQAIATRRRQVRTRWIQGTLVAASLMGAIAAGWLARGALRVSAAADQTEMAAQTVAEPAPPAERTLTAVTPIQAATDSNALRGQASPSQQPPVHADAAPGVQLAAAPPRDPRVTATPVAVQVTSLSPADDEPAVPFEGLWQSVDWQEAQALTGGNVPYINGLTVIDVQVQRASDDERPIVVVSQQHPAGGVIRTIEGPFERVEALVAKGAGRRLNTSAASFTPPDYLSDGKGGTKRGLRILAVTGSFPADSLNALAQQIDLRD
jgi:Putative zinc-finger